MVPTQEHVPDTQRGVSGVAVHPVCGSALVPSPRMLEHAKIVAILAINQFFDLYLYTDQKI